MGPSPQKIRELEQRMAGLSLFHRDIEEHFIRSPGKGGQNVNKVSTGVYLKHLPTGVEVKCTDTRSQYLNRFLALRRLIDKIESIRRGRLSELQQQIERIRRQKRKRSRRAKAKMLDSKHKHSAKKSDRGWSLSRNDA